MNKFVKQYWKDCFAYSRKHYLIMKDNLWMEKMVKEREKCQKLQNSGYSIQEISKKTKLSEADVWVRLALDENTINEWKNKVEKIY